MYSLSTSNMENPAQNTSQAAKTSAMPSVGPSTKILPLILVLVIGLIAGAVGGISVAKKQGSQVGGNQISESDLPIGIQLLKNPIVTQWRGAVNATLVAKTQNSLTLQDEGGNSIVIPLGYSPSLIAFYDGTIEATRAPKVTLEEIPIGSYLVADFFVKTEDKNQIYASTFTRIEKPQ